MFSWFGKVSFVPYSKVSDFAVHLKDGRMMGSRCKDCGYATFPPRADCPQCLSGNFEFKEYNGKGKIFTHTTITAAPTGFEDVAPYTVAVWWSWTKVDGSWPGRANRFPQTRSRSGCLSKWFPGYSMKVKRSRSTTPSRNPARPGKKRRHRIWGRRFLFSPCSRDVTTVTDHRMY